MINVAIFDDDSLMRQAIASMIDDVAGCRVCAEASDGKNAAQVIHDAKPDFVFMDTFMPEVDGLTALQAVKQTAPELPVVMMSAYEDATMVREAIRFGAADFLIKPFTRTVVEKVLTPLLKQHNAEQAQAEKLDAAIDMTDFEEAHHALLDKAEKLSADTDLCAHYDAVEAQVLGGYKPLGAPEIPENAQALGVDMIRWGRLKLFHTLCGLYEKRAVTANPLVQQILSALFDDLSVPVKLSVIGEAVHLTEGYISDVFKKEMGVSLIDYGHLGRMVRAAYWLLKDDLSAQELSDRLGYRGKSYFSKIFKKYIGQSLSDYKKDIKRQ